MLKLKSSDLTLIILAFGLSGCGATAGSLGRLPNIQDQQQAAKVIVYRPYNGLGGVANNYTLAVDGLDAFGISSKSNVQFYVEAGRHNLTIKCFGGITPTFKEDSIDFIAKPKLINYFEVNTASSFSKCATIYEVDDVTGFNRAALTNNLAK